MKLDFKKAMEASMRGPTHQAMRGVKAMAMAQRSGVRPRKSRHLRRTSAVSALVVMEPSLMLMSSLTLSGITPMKLMISSMVMKPSDAMAKHAR